MACVVVTTISAIGVAIASKATKQKETNTSEVAPKIPLSKKLSWLAIMLGFGSLLLIFEHVWHGEIVPWFPFLTAMSDPEATSEMLREMVFVGGSMTIAIVAVWACMVAVANRIAQRDTLESTQSA